MHIKEVTTPQKRVVFSYCFCFRFTLYKYTKNLIKQSLLPTFVILLSVRKIIHIDMDAFFAAVEQRDNPQLRSKPIAVGHNGRRGVVSTASYEARKFGVRSALPSVVAQRLCPQLIFVEPRFEAYKAVSEQIREIFHQYTDLVEPLSLDEAFLDVSHHRSATIIAQEIKQKIYQTTSLTASAGVSVNKMLAKIASDYRKPDGLFVIPPEDIDNFVAQLPIEKFFGIGQVTAEKMHRMGIHSGSDLRELSRITLVRQFGKAGNLYYGYARGEDLRPVEPHRVRKSIGAEITFLSDIDSYPQLLDELAAVRDEVWNRIKRHEFHGKSIVLKIKFDDFRQITRSKTLPHSVETLEILQAISEELLLSVELEHQKVRLIGLTVGNSTEPCTECVQLCFDF